MADLRSENFESHFVKEEIVEGNIRNISLFDQKDISKEEDSGEEVADISVNNIITKTILQEEKKLEEKVIKEEQKLRGEILKQEKKVLEEQCYKRLHLLLSRSSIYAKFMAEKLQRQNELIRKKQQKNVNSEGDKTLKEIQVDEHHSSSHQKRKKNSNKTEESSKKKHKVAVDVVDIFKRENMGNRKFKPIQENSNNLDVNSGSVNLEDSLDKHPKLFYGGIMKSYQIEGFEWLKILYENGVNGILADEMGLGKTIQCIAFIAYLIEMGVPGPFIVCAPLSTLPNWFLEFKRFTPDIPVILYHGEKNARRKMKKGILKKIENSKISCFPVVLTSYQIALIDETILAKVEWKLLVIDEAQRIKNFQCQLVKALKKYNSVHRLLLTGTPLQNDLSELWSLLNFLLPEIFDDLQVFESWFDISQLTEKGVAHEIIARQQEKQIVSMIHQILTPFLLRRTKAEVELSLPPKREIVVNAPLTDLQKSYYTSVLNKTIRQSMGISEGSLEISENLDAWGRSKRNLKHINYDESILDDFDGSCKVVEIPEIVENVNIPSSSSTSHTEVFADVYINLRNIVMILRKICCHPYLISYPLVPGTNQYLVDENVVNSSGKLLVVDAMLPELRKRGHKVLIFSQFISMLKILEDYCLFRKYPYNILNGTMKLSDREQEIKEFNESESSFLFLISTKAGGLGINLTAADTVIIYDSDWNPQNDLQAQDRCHRIGQTKSVVVYRLLVPKTIDERIIVRANTKRKLEKVIIQKGRFSSKDSLIISQNAITKEEMLELLESCDMTGFVKTDDNYVLSPIELEKLLDRSDLVNESKTGHF